MKKIMRTIVSLMVAMTIMSQVVYAGKNSNAGRQITVVGDIEQVTNRYPYDGIEKYVSPESNIYCKDYFQSGTFIKTEVYRLADDTLKKTIYADGTKEEYVIEPLSEESRQAYMDTYGYVYKEKKPEKKKMSDVQKLFYTLLFGGDVNYFYNTEDDRQGIVFNQKEKALELLLVLGNGNLTEEEMTEKALTQDQYEELEFIKDMVFEKREKGLTVLVFPYDSDQRTMGGFYNYKGRDSEPVLILINGEVSLTEQVSRMLEYLD